MLQLEKNIKNIHLFYLDRLIYYMLIDTKY